MRRTFRFVVLVSFWLACAPFGVADEAGAAALHTENIPDVSPKVRARLENYMAIGGRAFIGFVDGGLLVHDRPGDAAQVMLLPGGRAAAQAFANNKGPVRQIGVNPDGSGFVFARDRDGNENYRGFYHDLHSGTVTPVTRPGARAGGFVFSRQGQKLAWYRAPAGKSGWQIVTASLTNPQKTRAIVWQSEGTVIPLDWSADGRFLLFQRYFSISERTLFLLDLETGTARQINAGAGKRAYGRAFFGRHDKTIITQSDEGRGYTGILEIDLKSGRKRFLSPKVKGDVDRLVLSPSRRTMAYTINTSGRSALVVANARSGQVLAMPTVPPGVIQHLHFDKTGRRLGFTLTTAARPASPWVYHRHKQYAHPFPGASAQKAVGLPKHFITPERVHFTGKKNGTKTPLRIEGYLYKPPGKGPHPLIIYIHGGPESQYRPRFSAQIQYWVNELGLAVLAPNVRGSIGYGDNFAGLDDGVLREQAVGDIGAALDFIAARADLDQNRTLVYGASYGGYMALAALGHYPDRLAGGIDVAGISAFVPFLEKTSAYRRPLRRQEYGDEREPQMRAFLTRISPLTYAQKIKDPVLIVHGKNDPRVPVSQAVMMADALQKNNIPVWSMLADNEGHGYRQRANILRLRAAEHAFIVRQLGLTPKP